MKKQILKTSVSLMVIGVIIVAGVLATHPVISQAAAKTVYNVTLLKGSSTVTVASINDGTPALQSGSLEGTTFQLIVEGKIKTEKVKSTGSKAEYYPVTLVAKSWKSPTVEYPIIGGGGTAVKSSYFKGDGKGKLYVSGGDVDYSMTQGEKKATYKYGDGKADLQGSLFLPITAVSALTNKETGKFMQNVVQLVNLTTGTCSVIAQGVKGGLNGKALPADGKSTKLLPDPFIGHAIDLDAGTGTAIAVSGAMNGKNKMINGTVDNITSHVWIMKITK
jgi:hypothetical protein